jgi:hypothetical protein
MTTKHDDLLNAIISGEYEFASSAFSDIMNEKISDALEFKRHEVAQTMFEEKTPYQLGKEEAEKEEPSDDDEDKDDEDEDQKEKEEPSDDDEDQYYDQKSVKESMTPVTSAQQSKQIPAKKQSQPVNSGVKFDAPNILQSKDPVAKMQEISNKLRKEGLNEEAEELNEILGLIAAGGAAYGAYKYGLPAAKNGLSALKKIYNKASGKPEEQDDAPTDSDGNKLDSLSKGKSSKSCEQGGVCDTVKSFADKLSTDRRKNSDNPYLNF